MTWDDGEADPGGIIVIRCPVIVSSPEHLHLATSCSSNSPFYPSTEAGTLYTAGWVNISNRSCCLAADKYLVFEVVIFAESIPRPGVSWAAAAAGVLMLGAKSLLRSAAAA